MNTHSPIPAPPQHPAATPRPGFTLVELLVVVAIIALLLGILLPALAGARQAAQASVCLANMRHMGLASLMFAQEHDQNLPTVGLSHGSHQVSEQGSWFRLLEPYAGNDLLYRCPTDRSPYFDAPPKPGARLRKLSFATNYYVSGQMAGFEEFGNLNQLERPVTTIFAVELTEGDLPDGTLSEYYAADHIHADLWIARADGEGRVDAAARPMVAFDRHAGKANYALLDGHAEALPLHDTMRIGAGSNPMNINWMANKYDPTIAR